MSTDPLDFCLCYVDSRDKFAWFTSIPLEKQWGDDWDDAPYEHNAGEPYDDHKPSPDGERVKHRLVEVAWRSEHMMPSEAYVNSPYSVQRINGGEVAWLASPTRRGIVNVSTHIYAGTTLRDFIMKIKSCGGEVYLPTSMQIPVQP